MCNQYTVPDPRQKFRQDLTDIALSSDIVISDRGQPGDMLRNRSFRIHKVTEPVNDLFVLNLDRTYFNNTVCFFVKSGRLNIKYNVGILKVLTVIVDNSLSGIIDDIGFDSVDNFDIDLLRSVHCFRESLHDAMISNGDGFMSPTECLHNQIFGAGNGIHF